MVVSDWFNIVASNEMYGKIYWIKLAIWNYSAMLRVELSECSEDVISICYVQWYSDFRCNYRISDVVQELGMLGGFGIKNVSGYVQPWTCTSAHFSCTLLAWAKISIKSDS